MTKLQHIPTLPPKGYTKENCNKDLAILHKKLFKLQNVFYADSRFAILIIFQGLDTSGKDGTIRHVMTSMNPMGLSVKSFKVPTEEENNHDFMWRAYPHFPAKGMIEVFNRSYYESIVVSTIERDALEEIINQRYDYINLIEQNLISSNTIILKFYLHISKEIQVTRIQERLTQENKRWKYSDKDKIVSERWDDYINVYDSIIQKCNITPWCVIPSDKRWYRNYSVAKILTDKLESLDLKYPKS